MPTQELTARDMLNLIDANLIIRDNREDRYSQGFTLGLSENGFLIEGGLGYIINAREDNVIEFSGTSWTKQPPDVMIIN